MSYYLGLLQLIGIHTLLGLSAYIVMLTGQLSLGQAGFFAIGAYSAGILTVIFELPILPALLAGALIAAFFAFLVGFPALRVKGLMLVVATIAFGEFVRLFLLQPELARAPRRHRGRAGQHQRVPRDPLLRGERMVGMGDHGPSSGSSSSRSWSALWWMDRSRAGRAVLRAVGEDELAAQSVGISLTTVKVAAMTAGGLIAGIGGGALRAHRDPTSTT